MSDNLITEGQESGADDTALPWEESGPDPIPLLSDEAVEKIVGSLPPNERAILVEVRAGRRRH